jgi:sarcosine oxidase subunit beta
MNLPETADIVIVGGGVMGASTLYHLSARGMKNVVLLERNEFFGQEATGRCAGGVRYQFATEVNIKLSIESLPMLDRFKSEIGQDVNYRKCGYLFVLTNEKDVETFKHNVALQNKLGVETEWLTGDEVRRKVPYMNFEDAMAGTFSPNDGLVDPNSVVMGYIGASLKLGAKAYTEIEVIGLELEGDRISGVKTNKGVIRTPIVVNAAGPWAGLVGKMAGVDIPITSLRRQMFTTTPLSELPGDFPFVIDFAQSLYFHREGEGVLTGMSNPNETHAFDENVDETWEIVNLEAAISRMPMLEKAGMMSHWAGLYEVTPDAHPIYGKTPVEGFYIVGGFSGHGFMHGPVSGKLMAEIILEGKAATLDISQLDLARFVEGRLIREYNVV